MDTFYHPRRYSFTLRLYLLVSTLLNCPVDGWTVADETGLRSSLLTGYNTLVRPAETVNVLMTFQMTSLDSVNIKSQTFGVTGWWDMTWYDSRLAWTQASHANIPVLQLYYGEIWTPAIVITNCVTNLSAITESTIPMRVSSDGRVDWKPPGIFTTGCTMATTKYPFDEQTCSIQTTSFGYTMDEVIVNSTQGIQMYYYSESGDWEVEDTWYAYDTYQDNGNDYSRMTFYITVKRLNVYHWVNVLLPVGINSFLVMIVFMLPADSGEKIAYSLTTLLTYVVLMTLIASDMPTTAKTTSTLEVYMTIALLLSGISVYYTIVSIKYYHLPVENQIPRIVIRICQTFWPRVDKRKEEEKKSSREKIQSQQEQLNKYKKENTIVTPTAGFTETKEQTTVHDLSPESSISKQDYAEELITGKVISCVLDSMLLRVYIVVVPFITIIVLIAMMA